MSSNDRFANRELAQVLVTIPREYVTDFTDYLGSTSVVEGLTVDPTADNLLQQSRATKNHPEAVNFRPEYVTWDADPENPDKLIPVATTANMMHYEERNHNGDWPMARRVGNALMRGYFNMKDHKPVMFQKYKPHIHLPADISRHEARGVKADTLDELIDKLLTREVVVPFMGPTAIDFLSRYASFIRV